MILVDVMIPSIDKSYDFNVDENAQIALVMEEIVEMISQKEQCKIIGNKENLLLCQYAGQAILNKQMTLKEYGITNGYKLLLV